MITFEDVEVSFGDFVALPNLSLTIEESEFFTLLGPSGCGKTTALRALAGLAAPTAGRILLGGKDITRLPPDKREIGMVFQNYALFPSMRVRENIGFGLGVQRRPRSEIAERVAEIAAAVSLTDELLSKSVAELSGGQQQRVAIARSLVTKPKILLLDEPLSNLDAKLRQQLRRQLKDLQAQFGITTVYVTHDQEEALTMSDRVAVMNLGQIEQVGTPQEIYDASASEFVCNFVGDVNPLSAALLDRLRRGDNIAAGTAYIRVEKPTIAPIDAAVPGVGLPGVVASRAFHGLFISYRVRIGDDELTVIDKAGGDPFIPGAGVLIGIDPADLLTYAPSS